MLSEGSASLKHLSTVHTAVENEKMLLLIQLILVGKPQKGFLHV